MGCKTPFERLCSFIFRKTTLGFVLVGLGVGTILVLVLPIRVWLMIFAICSIGYGIFCIKDYYY